MKISKRNQLNVLVAFSMLSFLGAGLSIEAAPPAKKAWKYQASLLRPFWKGDVVEKEPILFLQNPKNKLAQGKLIFPVTEILSVQNASGTVTYTEGKDYTWEPGSRTIVLPEGSRIVSRTAAQMKRPANSQQYRLTHRDGNGEILFGGLPEYHFVQTAITYRHQQSNWKKELPKYSPEQLPQVTKLLKEGKPLSLVVLGDSISAGGDASGVAGGEPFQPAYPELLKQNLEAKTKSKVTLKNLSVGGMSTPWGVTQIEKVVKHQPDLVILAFGMNDSAGRPAKDFQANTKKMIEDVQKALPECEFILVAPMLGNPDWVLLKQKLFPEYRDSLSKLCQPGIALADLTTVWQGFLEQKNFFDLVGNGVNHPNDFGHRVYAQVIAALLVE